MLRLVGPHRHAAAGLCLLLLLFPALLRAQSTTGVLGGTVFDSAHAVVPNARILAVNDATGAEFLGYSDRGGNYALADLPPGTYSVDIAASAFAAFTAKHVVVELGRRTILSTALLVSASTSTVDVHTVVPFLQATYPSLATNVTQTQLLDIPSDSRRWSSFALLTPGVVSDHAGNGLLSFRGVSVSLNNNTVDGADNNEAFFSEERGRTRAPYSISMAAVEQFQVNTADYSAQYGRSAGGVINTVTKSGTNRLHGQLFYFERNSDLAATNPYTTLTNFNTSSGNFVTNPFRPLDVRRQTGFAAGGPIRKNRLFWFYAFDYETRDFPSVSRVGYPRAIYAQPIASIPTGNYLGFPISCANLPPYNSTGQHGSVYYASVFQFEATQGACQTYDRLDLPSYPAGIQQYRKGLQMIGTLSGLAPRTGHQTLSFPKLDWLINDRNHATFSYNRMRWNSPNGVQTQSSTQYGVHSLGDDAVSVDWGIARLTTFLTENVANEFRLQLSHELDSEASPLPAGAEAPLGQNQFGLAPEISIAGGASGEGMILGNPAKLPRPEFPDEHRAEISDSISWVAGNHILKVGADWDRNADLLDNLNTGAGKYYYTSFAGFLADYYHAVDGLGPPPPVYYVDSYAGFSQTFGQPGFFITTNDFSGFLNDEWRALPRLTLTAGMRYEYERVPHSFLINPQLPQTANYPDDRNNLGPRTGVAWDIFGNARTILRAGFGVFYGRIVNNTLFSALTSTGSPQAQRTYRYPSSIAFGAPQFPSIDFSAPTGAARFSLPSAYYFAKGYQAPESLQGTFALEQNIRWNTVLTLSYLTSQGRDLPNFIDTNIDDATIGELNYTIDIPGPPLGKRSPLPQGAIYSTPLYTSIRPNYLYSSITELLSNVNSNYNAGVLAVEHRTLRGLSFGLNYTFAHALDYNENELLNKSPTNILEPNNMALEYGNSNTDVRQRLVAHGTAWTTWHKQGWRGYLLNDYGISPVVAWQTGLPYTLGVGGSAPGGAFFGINGAGGPSRLNILQRNSYRFPSTQTTSFRFTRRIPVGERAYVELFAETFNLTNTQNVTRVDTLGYTACSTPLTQGCPSGSTAAHPYLEFNPTYGVTTNVNSDAIYTPREIQLAARLNF
ncbi:MAG TPA: carboxypeptidase regulatory-like domain-containing protein [Acidobacteriaceae bacterium]|nr:carboxypeptidase regulatory-like domain-containing protein [Acidobacteriaceae bacterium]